MYLGYEKYIHCISPNSVPQHPFSHYVTTFTTDVIVSHDDNEFDVGRNGHNPLKTLHREQSFVLLSHITHKHKILYVYRLIAMFPMIDESINYCLSDREYCTHTCIEHFSLHVNLFQLHGTTERN